MTTSETDTLTVEVRAVAMYDAPGAVTGYFAALLGPASRTGNRTLLVAAMHHNNDWAKQIVLHGTGAECMAEWEAAKPRKLDATTASLNMIGSAQVEEINERQLYRQRK